MSHQINLKASTLPFGCGSVTRALMRKKQGPQYVQVVPIVKEGSVSVHRVMVAHTATDPCVLRIVG